MRTTLWLAASFLLIVGGRACLPVAIEKGIELGGERIVQADVEVSNVDLGVLAGRLAIDGLRVDSSPPSDAAPLLAVSRMAIELAPLALLSGRIHVEDVSVERSSMRFEISEDGRLRVPLLVELRLPERLPDLQVDAVSIAGVRLDVDDPFDASPPLRIDCGEVRVTGVRAERRALRVADVTVIGPELSVDREVVLGERGVASWALPPAIRTARGGEEEPLPPVSAAPSGVDAGAPLEVTLSHLRIVEGALNWVDRSFTPALEERDEGLRLEAHDIALREGLLADLRIEGQGLRGEPFSLALRSESGAMRIDLTASRVQLATFDPYARQIADFGLERGEVSLASSLRVKRGVVDSEHKLLLHDVRVEGAGFFRELFGLSGNLILALLEDDKGNVALALPVELHQSDDPSLALREALRSAVFAALDGSLTDLEGAVGPDGYGLPPLSAEPGAVALRQGGEARLESLASLLRARREVVLILAGASAAADRDALAARATPDPAAIGDAELRTLARDRAEAIRTALIEAHGVSADSIRIAEPVEDASPGIRLELASAKD